MQPSEVAVNGEIIPSATAGPDELQKLGAAVDAWARVNIRTSRVGFDPSSEESMSWSEGHFYGELDKMGVPHDSPLVARTENAFNYTGTIQWYDMAGVQALLAGELPLPISQQAINAITDPRLKPEFDGRSFSEEEFRSICANPDNFTRERLSSDERRELRAKFGPAGRRRIVWFVTRQQPAVPRDLVIDSLRARIPPELVEDILVNGKSWILPD